jgi:hypothetical protein
MYKKPLFPDVKYGIPSALNAAIRRFIIVLRSSENSAIFIQCLSKRYGTSLLLRLYYPQISSIRIMHNPFTAEAIMLASLVIPCFSSFGIFIEVGM